ncbi:uncharacterized protein LOC126681416 [Mercurialis annua]|uniref:uncharacterized protein LOC126681416 n=1 Tax=Mercurialis annua TaxID=3986 RepID=UPI00215EABCF|nr:uncharacterized protein LOC126681416 [Mercurialis annua]
MPTHYIVDLTVDPLPSDTQFDDYSCFNMETPQIYFTLSYQLCHETTLHATDIILDSSTCEPTFADPFFLDIDLSMNHQAMYSFLSPRFARLGICPPDSPYCKYFVLGVIHEVDTMIPRKFKNRNAVFAFNINILTRCVRSYGEEEAMDLVMRQSRLEYESRDCGMVPTAPKSRRLKCVKLGGHDDPPDADAGDGRQRKRRRVGKKEICTVCLEELEDFAAGMPCGHLFHGICINKWLENSHYCPVCRYEMPTDH